MKSARQALSGFQVCSFLLRKVNGKFTFLREKLFIIRREAAVVGDGGEELRK